MQKVVIVATVAVLAISMGACVGKGKGKAPPPVAAPIVTKG